MTFPRMMFCGKWPPSGLRWAGCARRPVLWWDSVLMSCDTRELNARIR